ncbi:hypothetical protein QAD02_007365 [Eretmocerus hayati]|uniref:Uncharacterized protein n=1 Tax=Eretmocerus hayati TaxID=131215 RepID=A0ACC2N4Q7_9HYME|nr:hypothetical protein QAD02_007365 [Eretmocerus hayati]
MSPDNPALPNFQERFDHMNFLLANPELASFEDFVSFDNDVAVTGLMSDAEVIESLENTNPISADLDHGSYDDFDDFPVSHVSRREVEDAVHVIRCFFGRSDVNFEDVNPAMMKIVDTVDQCIAQNLIQQRIIDHFLQV